MMNNDLIQKLMISKKIMDKHKEMPRGQNATIPASFDTPIVEEFSAPNATYNIPQEYISETQISKPVNNNVPTKDRILNSKLPDEIKRLMLEHPINQPQNTGPVLSDELVEAASRLMKKDGLTKQESKKPVSQPSGVNLDMIRQVVRETVESVLKENGLLVEGESATNETIKFQVGQHIFEGKVTKIKKLK